MAKEIKPEILFYVDDGRRWYLPYPGSLPVGGKEAAERIVNANPGWKVRPMRVFPYVGDRVE